MTSRSRRPRPPRLDDPAPPLRGEPAEPTPTTPRGRLLAGRASGPHPHLGRAEVAHSIACLTGGATGADYGLDLGRVTREEAWDAIAEVWGWRGDAPRARIDPDRTIAGFDAALRRLRAVAAAGGRIAFATGRPASMLGVYRVLAAEATARGGTVLACDRYGPIDGRGLALWWHDGVAVVTDGEGLLGDDGLDAGEEWLFAVGRCDLAVADHGFAGAAAAAGYETLAFVDLDAVALAVAARRGRPLGLVPLHDGCPPAAYAPLVERVGGAVDLAETPADRADPGEAPEPDVWTHAPHSTTPAPRAYAAPESGGEG